MELSLGGAIPRGRFTHHHFVRNLPTSAIPVALLVAVVAHGLETANDVPIHVRRRHVVGCVLVHDAEGIIETQVQALHQEDETSNLRGPATRAT